MINKAIINAVLNSATKENKDKVLNELLNHISLSYDYNDGRAAHILEMLCDSGAIISDKDINLDYINKNLRLVMYDYDKYNIKNIKVADVDNIDCTVKIEYEYLDKINEDRGDISYANSYTSISFIHNPDILKK